MHQKAFKYRIYPTKEQEKFLNETLGACRKAYNLLLDKSIKDYEAYKLDPTLPKPDVSGYSLAKQLTIIKGTIEYSWLYNYSSQALKSKLHDLGDAFKRFFNKKTRAGYPQFKSRYGKNTFRLYAGHFNVKDNKLSIAKLDTLIKIRWDKRILLSDPSQITISKTSTGEYYVSFLCKVTPKVTNGSDVVGIDLGVKDLVVTSDGEVIANPRHYDKYQERLALLQRRLSRKVKGSNNRNKARLKVAKLHEKITNVRKDFLHKLSRSLVNRCKTIVIEDLNVKGMVRNHKLAKHVTDASFGMFKNMLVYKSIESYWCNLVIADPWYPSTQLCSHCDTKPDTKLTLNQREWTCSHCHTRHHRDFNASKNLEKIAYRSSVAEALTKLFGTVSLATEYTV